MPGFDSDQKLQLVWKATAARKADAQEAVQAYESKAHAGVMSAADDVILESDLILANPATSLAAAQALAAGVLSGVIFDASASASAIRLTPIPGIDNTYIALSVYGDFSTRIKNWIGPAFVPQTNGQTSSGYTVALFEGDPDVAGTPVGVTDDQSPDGSTAWEWDYDNGILYLSDTTSIVTDPYVNGFYYIGKKLESSSLPRVKQYTTVNATPVAIDTIPMPTDGVVLVHVAVVAKQQSLSTSAVYTRMARVTVVGGVPTIGTIQTVYTDEADTSWNVDIVNNGGLIQIEVTGAGGTTIDWVASTSTDPSLGVVTPITITSPVQPDWSLFGASGYNSQPPSTSTITMTVDARDTIVPGQPIRLFVNTALEFNDGSNRLSGFDNLTGLTESLLGRRGRLYYDVEDLGGSTYKVHIYTNPSMTTKIGETASYGSTGAKAVLPVSSSGLGGTITVDSLGAGTGIYTEHYRWMIVDDVTDVLMTLHGPPLTAAAGWILAMWTGLIHRIGQSEAFIQGTFADGASSTLIKTQGLTAFRWRGGNARLVEVGFWADTRTNSPVLKVHLNAVSAMTTGITLSAAQIWLESVVQIDPTNTLVARGTDLEVETTDGTAAGDSDLTVSTVWVLE
jgi:hypothetical protein